MSDDSTDTRLGRIEGTLTAQTVMIGKIYSRLEERQDKQDVRIRGLETSSARRTGIIATLSAGVSVGVTSLIAYLRN